MLIIMFDDYVISAIAAHIFVQRLDHELKDLLWNGSQISENMLRPFRIVLESPLDRCLMESTAFLESMWQAECGVLDGLTVIVHLSTQAMVNLLLTTDFTCQPSWLLRILTLFLLNLFEKHTKYLHFVICRTPEMARVVEIFSRGRQ